MKENPIIENIMIPEERLAEYQERLKGNKDSPIQVGRQCKEALVKEYFGICSICGGMPRK